MDYNTIASHLNNFKKLVESNGDKNTIAQQLGPLKLAATIYLEKPTSTTNVSDKVLKDLVLAREILELISLYSIKIKEIDSFERSFNQLRPYYYDYKSIIPASQLEFQIIGLNLMRLLAQHKTSEFHSELELISVDNLNNVFIKFPLVIEKSITEGSYNKVVHSKTDVPSEYYQIFCDILVDSIKEDIANCSEKSFKTLSLKDAEKVLLFNNTSQFQQYIKDRNWKVQGDTITFGNTDNQAVDIPSLQLIHQTLHYAKELERIV
ncbi:hypothetical protein DICPUDRAFT_49021 [Dictyostelium purpureum]|uniref:PCI domain-containing protein n=1 Tax=Dictyostelium purpureum TaxID=5786 RepID=F0ZRZ3_DICPU|nr:uncharacterized protein DICPUDRAFT_49021 [Dictyostelium purpureum]EGC33281.1 hypothetical protein DICPUDRAFT_49021 [Dictyostelium purpureum]|eukprot:XP_003290182.1 hypothetical protein DICPUDRAFT_49021 [Dictyostelium purpureum]